MDTIKLLELKKLQTNFPKSKITNSRDGYNFVRQFYCDDIDIFESFFILMLNRNNSTISYAKISQGGVSGTVVDVKLIAKYAVDSLCSNVILCHNHPSGNIRPSQPDIDITNKIKDGLDLLEIRVVDHLIISSESYYSFADEGLI